MSSTIIKPDSSFWSDDFDMDLLRVHPEAVKLLEDTGKIPLWTTTHHSKGRLNHPTVWNSEIGAIAFFWLNEPQLQRDRYGWISIRGYVTDDQVFKTNWSDVVRDVWPHTYSIIFLDNHQHKIGQWKYQDNLTVAFDRLMAHQRGHSLTDLEVERLQVIVDMELTLANNELLRLVNGFE